MSLEHLVVPESKEVGKKKERKPHVKGAYKPIEILLPKAKAGTI